MIFAILFASKTPLYGTPYSLIYSKYSGLNSNKGTSIVTG